MIIYGVLLIFVVAIIFITVKLTALSNGRFYHWARKGKLLLGYFLILVVMTGIYFMFIQPKLANEAGSEITIPNLSKSAYHKSDPLPSQYIVEEVEITTDEKELIIRIEEGIWYFDSNYVPIVVERTTDSDKITAKLYETPSVASNIDISQYILLSEIDVKGNVIGFKADDDYVEINMFAIENEMTSKQFSNEAQNSLIDMDFNMEIGEQVLYLVVPEGIAIKADEEFDVTYVH